DVAGDGTTTATVLAQALVRTGLRNIAAGANPAGLKRGIDAAVTAICDALDAAATPVEGEQSIAHVGTISAQDAKIGALIGEAMTKVGKDGVITAEESNTLATGLEFTEGMQFDKGYISPFFVDRRKAFLQDLAIVTGAQVISPEIGLKLDQIGLDDLGTAGRVVVTKD